MQSLLERVSIIIKPVVFIVILVLLLDAAGFATSRPNVYTRIMMHEMYAEEQIDVVFIGGSRVFRGLDPEVFDSTLNINSFNMGSSGQGAEDVYYLLKEVFKYHSPQIVIIDVPQNRLAYHKNTQPSEILFDYFKLSINKIQYMANAFEATDFSKAIFPAMRSRNIKVLFSPKTAFGYIKTKVSPEYRMYSYSLVSYDDEKYEGKGFVYNENPISGNHRGRIAEPRVWREERVGENEIAFLEKSIRLCKEYGAIPILIETPPTLSRMAQYETHIRYCEYLYEFSKRNEVDFFSFALVKNNKFMRYNKYYTDSVHLTGEGAELFSNMLSSFLQKYLNGTLDVSEYLYDSSDCLLEDCDFVFDTWFSAEEGVLKAYALSGSNVKPEFEFLCKTEEDAEFAVVREYSDDPCVPDIDTGGIDYTLRVNARARGSKSYFEEYEELEIKLGNAIDEGIGEEDVSQDTGLSSLSE